MDICTLLRTHSANFISMISFCLPDNYLAVISGNFSCLLTFLKLVFYLVTITKYNMQVNFSEKFRNDKFVSVLNHCGTVYFNKLPKEFQLALNLHFVRNFTTDIIIRNERSCFL